MPLPDTRPARQAIFAALRGVVTPPLPAPDLAPYHASPFGRGSVGARIAAEPLRAEFEKAARGWRADVLHARPDNWPGAVRQALAQRGLRSIAIGAASPLQPGLDEALRGLAVRRFEQPLETWKGELFDTVDAAVTATVAGIADTGTLVLCPGAHEPRTLSLVPPVHVAVLMASRLHASLPAAMRALYPGDGPPALPTNLLLVTGPSKTADIQQVLAYGAHGPKELVIVLVDDLAEATQ
ncbi:LutC/YkgG family protein [Ramlibacter sp. AN1133]|uniref:LutC/YkgG family protein n=1 Tax=Ramlibacter sp. AN1133 TaxID=3133429 RepID=UPI0030C19CE5